MSGTGNSTARPRFDRDRIKELLGSGLGPTAVATAIGCEPSAITNLMMDEEFRLEIMSLRSERLTKVNARDDKLGGIEDDLIEKIANSMDMLYKPRDLLAAFRVINSAQRRGVPAHETTVVNNTVVNLTLPKEVVKSFTMTPQGEIVEVEGQTLVTMPTQQLLRQLAERGKDGRYDKVARFLPSAGITEGTGEMGETAPGGER